MHTDRPGAQRFEPGFGTACVSVLWTDNNMAPSSDSDSFYHVNLACIACPIPCQDQSLGFLSETSPTSQTWYPPLSAPQSIKSFLALAPMLVQVNPCLVPCSQSHQAACINVAFLSTRRDEVDYLLIDTPPGTSDEHLSITSYLNETGVDGAVIVTTPQVRLAQQCANLTLSNSLVDKAELRVAGKPD